MRAARQAASTFGIQQKLQLAQAFHALLRFGLGTGLVFVRRGIFEVDVAQPYGQKLLDAEPIDEVHRLPPLILITSWSVLSSLINIAKPKKQTTTDTHDRIM